MSVGREYQGWCFVESQPKTRFNAAPARGLAHSGISGMGLCINLPSFKEKRQTGLGPPLSESAELSKTRTA